jgi:cephalosporin hydroxylase
MPPLPPGVRRRLRELALAAARRLSTGAEWERHVRDEFTDRYYELGEAGGTWKATTWLGVPAWKVPLDLWVYQELVWEQRPDLIIETGTAHGGSALYLATLCEAVGRGQVISVDIGHWPDRPAHPRLTYLTASSTDPLLVAQVAERAEGAGCVLVVLDSDHCRDHVLAELRAYAPMVTPGGYLVVEDTTVNGHPVNRSFGPGPMEAVRAFLAERDDFEVDRSREKFLLTFNPGGWLRRLA